MKKFIIGVLMLSITFGGYFSDNFLKYSTFYGSVSLESPFTPKQKFAVNTDEGTFEETTEEIEASYNLTVGVRKLARFKYQVKKSNFYDGSENELSEKALKFTIIVLEASISSCATNIAVTSLTILSILSKSLYLKPMVS